MHGVALNVDMDLSPFRGITPCGLQGCRATSMAEVAGRPGISREWRRASTTTEASGAVRLPGRLRAAAPDDATIAHDDGTHGRVRRRPAERGPGLLQGGAHELGRHGDPLAA